MKPIYKSLVLIIALFSQNIGNAHAQTIEEANKNLKDAMINIKKLISEESNSFCINHAKINGYNIIAINSLDIIVSKSSNTQEVKSAKKFQAELIEIKNTQDKKYQENCAEIYEKFLKDFSTREQYVKEFNENMYQAHRFRERALQNTNRYEACQSLYSEKTYLDKAKISLSIASGRFEKTAQDEAKSKANLNDKINQNQVDGKYNGCW